MADPDPTPARYGLILGDSILYNYYDHDEPLLNSMKKKFSLDVIINGCKKGGTVNRLVRTEFPRELVKINNSVHGNDFTVDIFLVAGAVDMSDAISDDLDFDLQGFLTKRMDLFRVVCEHVFVRDVYIFPLTLRTLCRVKEVKKNFPKYAVRSWVDFANVCIRRVNKYKSPWISPKLHFVDPSVVRDIGDHIARDGIHLTEVGKSLLANSVLGVLKQQPPKKVCWGQTMPDIFSDEFPPLECDYYGNPLQPLDVALASSEAKRRDSHAIRKIIMAIDNSFVVVKSGRETALPAPRKDESMIKVIKSAAIVVEPKTKKKNE